MDESDLDDIVKLAGGPNFDPYKKQRKEAEKLRKANDFGFSPYLIERANAKQPTRRHALIEAAHGSARTKNKYLKAYYHRVAAHRGKKKALVAVGHSILIIAYHLLTRRQQHSDLGANYFDERDRTSVRLRCIKRLEKLGFSVAIEPLAA